MLINKESYPISLVDPSTLDSKFERGSENLASCHLPAETRQLILTYSGGAFFGIFECQNSKKITEQ